MKIWRHLYDCSWQRNWTTDNLLHFIKSEWIFTSKKEQDFFIQSQLFKLDVNNATIKCIVVVNTKTLDDFLLKMNELNINDVFINKSHENKLFNNELSSIEFNYDSLENLINEKILFIHELNILNQLFVRWLNENKLFSHDLFQNNELLLKLSQNEDLFNHNHLLNDKNSWRKKNSTTFFFSLNLMKKKARLTRDFI